MRGKEEGESCSLKVRESIRDIAGYFQLLLVKDDHKHNGKTQKNKNRHKHMKDLLSTQLRDVFLDAMMFEIQRDRQREIVCWFM